MDKKIKVIVSCSSKFHAFAMAEQFEKHGILNKFFTTFASQKNSFFKKFVNRIDLEIISKAKFVTNILLGILFKILPQSPQIWNDIFDRWVAFKIKKNSNFDVFIGWSGMSLFSIRASKRLGKITIVERGSSHILFQNDILNKEYARFSIDFSINQKVIEKELKEYQEADYISIPSNFVKNSFLEMGIDEKKLVLNPYGVSLRNFGGVIKDENFNQKLKLLYLGNLSFRKGIPYLFQALKSLKETGCEIEVHFIGTISPDFELYCSENKMVDWVFHGHIPHHLLKNKLHDFDLAIHPSLEEGLSMVLAQLLASGIPVIATTNTGGTEFIKDSYNGFIVPIRNSEAIKEKIELLHSDRKLLKLLKENAHESVKNGFTWDDYGLRYLNNLKKTYQC